MYKFKTRLLKYSDKSFKKKFADLIHNDGRSTNEINVSSFKFRHLLLPQPFQSKVV